MAWQWKTKDEKRSRPKKKKKKKTEKENLWREEPLVFSFLLMAGFLIEVATLLCLTRLEKLDSLIWLLIY